MKRQAIDWQKIFAKHLSYILKGACIKCIQTSFKTQQLENNPIEKWKKDQNRYFTKKKKRIYRCEISLRKDAKYHLFLGNCKLK